MEQYISKSALVAEIEKKIMQYEVAFNNPSFASYEASLIAKGKYRKLLDIRQFLDTLEVKEVDFEEVFNDEYSKFSNDTDAMDYAFPIDLADYRDFAKHFFELGMTVSDKEQKG